MTRLILLRHGQTPSNLTGAMDTAVPGDDLTEAGVAQAAAVVDALAGERIDRIITSPLARAAQTGGPIASDRGLPLGLDSGLREVMAGELEMRTDKESQRAYLMTLFAWVNGDLNAAMPGRPETGAEFFDRFDRAVESAVDGVHAALCISHGAAIRIWASCRAANVPDDFGAAHDVPNTGVVILERSGVGPWSIIRWTDTDYDATACDL